MGDTRRRSILLDSASCGHRPQAADADKKSGKSSSELKNLSTHCGHQNPDKVSGKRRKPRQMPQNCSFQHPAQLLSPKNAF